MGSRAAVPLVEGASEHQTVANQKSKLDQDPTAVAVLVQLLLQLKKILDELKGTLWEHLRAIRTELNQRMLIDCGSPPGCRWSAPPIKGLTS